MKSLSDTCRDKATTVSSSPFFYTSDHIGGEKVFVDFAGDTIDIFDPITGEVRAMKLFVAAMGASNYTYAEACPSESLSDWIGVHANLFRYLGGVPKFVVCDNLKAAVTNPDRYDPGINRT